MPNAPAETRVNRPSNRNIQSTNQSVFSLSSPTCGRNKGRSQIGAPHRRSHRREGHLVSRRRPTAKATFATYSWIQAVYRLRAVASTLSTSIADRAESWSLAPAHIGRFSIDECLKDEQFVHQDPTHRRFIALAPERGAGSATCAREAARPGYLPWRCRDDGLGGVDARYPTGFGQCNARLFFLDEMDLYDFAGDGDGVRAKLTRLARPTPSSLRGLWLLGIPVLVLASIGIGEFVYTPPSDWLAMWLGGTWMVCPWLVLSLAAPIFIGLLWSFRKLAPTSLRAAGAAAGLAAGAWAAAIYCLRCPEASAIFVLTWYTLGIVLAAGVGAVLGPRLMRW